MDLGSPLDRRRLLPGIGQRRRLAAAALCALAVVCALSALRPAAPATVRIWSAARDLTGGSPLGAHDVRVERLPIADVPAGVLVARSPVIGRMLAAPVRRGEPLTDVRLLSTALLASLGGTGLVAVPVRVADGPATSALVQAGDRVDILASGDAQDVGGAPTSTVVQGVRVLAVPGADGDPGEGSSGDTSGDVDGLLVVAVTGSQADRLAQAATGARLSVAVRAGSR